MIIRNRDDHNVKEFFPPDVSIPNPPNFRTEVDSVIIRCGEDEFVISKTEFWNSSNELVRVQAINQDGGFKFSKFVKLSPFALMQEIACKKSFGGLGIRLGSENGNHCRQGL
jgi:hypothetical protein